ncbi:MULTISPECIES: HAMP domain-containing protein [Deefgea]|uniref:Sensor protein n=1 Tax=Deefgea chitinilytica TaxID=570276 RepID=A0ABS2CC17_9NEIS|nr:MULTISPECIES: HAMP domain-containing protein [Deefgea]MBM5571685.1 HAMP domain-containing protein [Deefgea chitinilytica]MBM9888920.1 HAMP domain-containing protein [Deefgea sp. CFH1-16]
MNYFRQASIVRFITQALLLMLVPALLALILSWAMVVNTTGEGVAINVAGSLRKQTYLIVATHLSPPAPVPGSRPMLHQVIDEFERRLYSPALLKNLPDNPSDPIRIAYNRMEMSWRTEMKDLFTPLYRAPDGSLLPRAIEFAALIDAYVAAIEARHESRLAWLGHFQWISIGVMALFFALTLLWLRQRVTRPLTQMAAAAQKVKQGDLQVRAPEDGAGEITQLGQAFNHMVAELVLGIEALEARVAEKTQALTQNQRSLELLYRTKQRLSDQEPNQATFDEVLADVRAVVELEHAAICITETEQAPQAFRISVVPSKLSDACEQTDCADCAEAAERPLVASHSPVFKLSDGRRTYGIMPIQLKTQQALLDWQQQLLEAVARQIGTALANAKRKQEQHRLALHDERSVIARELHDSLAQSLSYLKIQVVRLENQFPEVQRSDTASAALGELREGLNGAYRQLRELLNTFRLQMNERGLTAALEQTVQEFSERAEHSIQLENRLLGVELAAHEEIHILQIVREALVNIERHAKAQQAWISLAWEGEYIVVRIADDGCGIDENPHKKQHYGLGIMQDRALSLHGDLQLLRREPRGTLVQLKFIPSTPFAMSNPMKEGESHESI